MIKAILFDIDGTLLDTRLFIEGAYLTTIKKHLGRDFDREYLMTFIPGTIYEVYGKALPDISIDILIKDHEIFQDNNLHLITMYDAVDSTLQTLKNRGIVLGAVTGRRKKSALTNLRLHNLDDVFDIIITPEDVSKAKPHPEGIYKAMKALHVKPAEVMMVGDAVSDIKAGQNAGVMTVGVTHGFSTRAQLEGATPDYIIDSISELPRLVH